SVWPACCWAPRSSICFVKVCPGGEMATVDRWLLPDGIEEVLPPEAARIEATRRQVLDLFQRWGYEFVVTPHIEFIESLLTGAGRRGELAPPLHLLAPGQVMRPRLGCSSKLLTHGRRGGAARPVDRTTILRNALPRGRPTPRPEPDAVRRPLTEAKHGRLGRG